MANILLTREGTEARIKEIEARREWMSENLEGCDWCCGGGDEEWLELDIEMAGLMRVKEMLDRADEYNVGNDPDYCTVQIVEKWAMAGPQYVFKQPILLTREGTEARIKEIEAE
jgi:hypothetical protein